MMARRDFSECVTLDDYCRAMTDKVTPPTAPVETPVMWKGEYAESRIEKAGCHQCFYLVRCKNWRDLANPCAAFSADEVAGPFYQAGRS